MVGSSLLNLLPSAAITSPTGSLCLISSKCCHQSGFPKGNWGDFSSLLKCSKGSRSFTKHPKSFPFRRISEWGVRLSLQPCHSCPQPDVYVATNRSPWWLLDSQHLHRIFSKSLHCVLSLRGFTQLQVAHLTWTWKPVYGARDPKGITS